MTITTDLNTRLSHSKSSHRNFFGKNIAALFLLGGVGTAVFGATRRGWQRMALGAAGGYLAVDGVRRMRSVHRAVRVSYTISQEPEKIYNFIRDAGNWQKFLQRVEIESSGAGSFEVVLGRALGIKLQSRAQVTDQEAGKFIAWSSLPGALEHRGVIRLTPAAGARGTEVSVALEYTIAGGAFSEALAMFRGKGPEQLVRENLRALKQLIESGEIATITGQPAGDRGVKGAALRMLYREPQAEAPQEAVPLAGD
jgi:uncharacterized membrane protein